MGFCDESFLLSNAAAADLFHRVACGRPIVDYHCHLSPQDIAEDRRCTGGRGSICLNGWLKEVTADCAHHSRHLESDRGAAAAAKQLNRYQSRFR